MIDPKLLIIKTKRPPEGGRSNLRGTAFGTAAEARFIVRRPCYGSTFAFRGLRPDVERASCENAKRVIDARGDGDQGFDVHFLNPHFSWVEASSPTADQSPTLPLRGCLQNRRPRTEDRLRTTRTTGPRQY